MKNPDKVKSVMIILVIYLLTFFLTSALLDYLPAENFFFRILYADIIATIIIFSFSMVMKNSSVYDPYWSVTPPVIAGYLMFINPGGNPVRQIMVSGIILFWGIRLTLNWMRGWRGMKHEDWRYKGIAARTGKYYWLVSFLGIHLVPTLFVYFGCLPLFYILPDPSPVSPFEMIALLIATFGILLEWTSDEQLRSFKKRNPPTAFIKSGAWSLLRHPNYLGEILFWVGIFLFIPLDRIESSFWTCIGFISIIFLFNLISVPLMDKRNIQSRPGYVNYMKNTPALVPSIKNMFENR